MDNSVQSLLDSFERLPDDAKREAASEIMRRSVNLNLPPLPDDTLNEVADKIFLELDKNESQNG